MKQTIDYVQSEMQMGDLLETMEVSIKNDFSVKERMQLKKSLEDYMSGKADKSLTIDLKKFLLVVKGSDEASYLYQYVN